MWNGSLGAIKATEHGIGLKLGTSPVRSMPSRQGTAMRGHTEFETDKLLTAGVIEPATSELSSPVVLAS